MPLFRFARGKRFDVAGFGGNTEDHLCVVSRPPGSDVKQRLVNYRRQPGGQVPTALVALQRWGLTTAYAGAFGGDGGGARQRASLIAESVDVTATSVRANVGSHTSVILIDGVTGARTVLWQRPPGLLLRAEELDRGIVTDARVLLMDAEDPDSARQAAQSAKAAGVVVVLDIDSPGSAAPELLRLTDVLIVPDGFPQQLTGTGELRAALRQLRRRGPRLVAVTLGAGGALALADDRIEYVPAIRVPVVDTTSAGDLFHAGCIYGLLQAWPITDVLHFASASAALQCTRLGGRAAIPALEEVRRLVLSGRVLEPGVAQEKGEP
jgi:sulfofructose kinase